LNESFGKLIGQRKEDIRNKFIWDLFPPEVTSYRKKVLEKVFTTGENLDLTEYRNNKFYETSVYPIFDLMKNVHRAAVFTRDITEQKKAEQEIKESHEKLQNLTKYLMTAREQERTSIARELHDELGQVLTAINMEAVWVAEKISEDQPLVRPRAEAISDLAVGAIQTVKRIISELRPTLLTDLGLAEAIKWQAEEYLKRIGIRFDVKIEPEDIFLDDDKSTAVFRIFQEATTNAIRHSHATRVSVSLKKHRKHIELRIKDNGIGITEEQLSLNESFGIMGMRERAEVFDGTLEIMGIPGKGTTLVVRFPF
jgi:PAS domain S-box-containing protein